MPPTRDVDHHDTALYIPLYHRMGNFSGHERETYKSLVKRLFHEGRVVDPDFLENEPNIRPTFAAINFNCLFEINEQICPISVLQFYKSFRIIRNLNGTISVAFVIDNVESVLTLENFARILRIPCAGVCFHSSEWSLSAIETYSDAHLDIYPPPTEEATLVRDALFLARNTLIRRKIKKDNVIIKNVQMLKKELKPTFKKWEMIVSDNTISLTGHKDHINLEICYMLYCLAIGKPFNLAYFVAF